ncbi:MAG: carbohydrate kinase [Bacteroidales bacterium]|jgi:fructokinase|nr:carbohydrate kinase [Bacteroidales bacterium]MDD4214235.1 carbohydrate kinase [Bacteroidales bacterium]
MRKIYCFGEAVYDIIFKNEIPVEAKPGGAMLNVAVSLGRLGLPVYFVGDFANDRVGNIIKKFLKENNVDTTYITMYTNAKSRIALAFLDEKNNADYSFYKIRIEDKPYINFPELQQDDILLFGSYYAIKPEIRTMVSEFIHQSNQKNALIVYDPNFRLAHLNMLEQLKPFIEENISIADITKGSDEDFKNIFQIEDAGATYNLLKKLGSKSLIYTRNRNGVDLQTYDFESHVPAIGVKPISTVGAGDTFTAGMAYWMYKNKIDKIKLQRLSLDEYNKMITMAVRFATDVCLSYDNYISYHFRDELIK